MHLQETSLYQEGILKNTRERDEAASTHDFIHQQCWVVIMNDIVASKIIMLVTEFNGEIRYRRVLQKAVVA